MPQVKRIDLLVKHLTTPKVERQKKANSIKKQPKVVPPQSKQTSVAQISTNQFATIKNIEELDDQEVMKEFIDLTLNHGGLAEPLNDRYRTGNKYWRYYRACMIALLYAKVHGNTMDKFQDLISKIESLTVGEMAGLVKVLEEKFGISAAAPVAAGGGASRSDTRRPGQGGDCRSAR